ncbi:hypothetical protein ACFX2A_039082 [Malus domestica]
MEFEISHSYDGLEHHPDIIPTSSAPKSLPSAVSWLVSSTAARPAFVGVSSTRLKALGLFFICAQPITTLAHALGLGLGSQFFLGPQFFGLGLDSKPQENKIGS